MMDEQCQLPGGRRPQCREHSARIQVKPVPCRRQRLVRQRLDGSQAVTGIHRTRIGHAQRPAISFHPNPQPQHRMAVQQGLEHSDQVGLGRFPGRLQYHCLIELSDRAFDGLQPPHDRGRSHRAEAFVDDVIDTDRAAHRRQPSHRLFDEHITRPELQTMHPRQRHHLHRQDAVPTQGEERVVDADLLLAEHLGIDLGQDPLDLGARSPEFICAAAVFRSRQGAPVEFSVDCQGQRFQRHHSSRDHVRRQAVGQCGANPGRIGCAGDVADQTLVAGTVFPGDHHGLVDAVRLRQDGLDLAQFDAVAPNLHLLVGTPQILQLPAAVPSRQVSGAIHPLPRRTERAGHKARCGQAAPPHVSDRQSRPSHIQLTRRALGRLPQEFVEHERRAARHRMADRHHAGVSRKRCADCRVDRGLCRPVGVDHHAPRRPASNQISRAGLAGHHQRRRVQTVRGQHACRGRSLAQHRHLLGDQQIVQVRR